METSSSAKTMPAKAASADLRSMEPLALCKCALEKVDASALPPEIGARLSEVIDMLERTATD